MPHRARIALERNATELLPADGGVLVAQPGRVHADPIAASPAFIDRGLHQTAEQTLAEFRCAFLQYRPDVNSSAESEAAALIAGLGIDSMASP
ncbi:MAG: hypothetical protein ABL878_09805 [Burkholderiales bacterium]